MLPFLKPSVRAKVLVLCTTAIAGTLYARNLNPVQWTLDSEQKQIAPGSSVTLRLHAQIAEGYRLYSFTTPKRGPVKTTASVEGNPAIEEVRVYQPKPDRHQDLTSNVPVETFEGGVDFLVTGKLSKNAALGGGIITVSVRYQACSDQLCLPPVRKTAAAPIAVARGAVTAKVPVPSGYRLVGGS